MKIFISSNNIWNILNFRKNLITKLLNNNLIYLFTNNNDKKIFKHKNLKIISLNFNSNFNILNDIFIIFKILIYIYKIKPNLILNYTLKPVLYFSLCARFFNLNVINTITGLGNTFLGNNNIKNVIVYLYKICNSKNNYFIFHNKSDKNFFIKNKISIYRRSFVTSGSGVDLKKFKTNNYKLNKKNVIKFILVGRFLLNKGIKEYIEMSKKFINNKKIKFYLLGSSLKKKNSYAISTKNLQKWLKGSNIKKLPFTNNIVPILKEMDCLVLPSYREGMSKSLMEGAAMGKILIASNVPGCREVVKNNYNGFLCKPRSTQSLIHAVKKVIKLSKKKKIKFMKNNKQLAKSKFDENLVIDLYSKIICKLK